MNMLVQIVHDLPVGFDNVFNVLWVCLITEPDGRGGAETTVYELVGVQEVTYDRLLVIRLVENICEDIDARLLLVVDILQLVWIGV